LERSWQFDRKAHHDGYKNKYTFENDGRKFSLNPFTSQEVYHEQKRLLSKMEEFYLSKEKNRRRDSKEKKEKEGKNEEQNKISDLDEKESRGKQKSFYAKQREIVGACVSQKPIVLLIFKEAFISTSNIDPPIPSVVLSLLQEFEDIFPEELPKELPPIWGIEHQIDLIPGTPLSNKPAYRTNPEETKELQRQVEELLK
jgi:hypothetical protein